MSDLGDTRTAEAPLEPRGEDPSPVVSSGERRAIAHEGEPPEAAPAPIAPGPELDASPWPGADIADNADNADNDGATAPDVEAVEVDHDWATELDGDDAPSWKTVGRVVAGLVVFGLVIRLADLAGRPLHHDESLDAWFSWKFLNGTYEGYDPVYHGPLRFYVSALFFAVMGESVFVTRLLAVLSGTVVLALPWLWRRDLGRIGTIGAVALLAVSPSMLYFSRMGREDAPFLALTFGIVIVLLAFLRNPRWWHPAALLVLLVSSMAVKESMFLVVFILGSFGMTVLFQDLLFSRPGGAHAVDGARRWGRTRAARWTTLVGLGLMIATFAWIGVDPGEAMSLGVTDVDPTLFKLALYGAALGLAIVVAGYDAFNRGVALDDVRLFRVVRHVGGLGWAFAIVSTVVWFVALFTQFFTRFSGPGSPTAPHSALRNGLVAGVEYWLGEQDTVRGDARWQYYLAVIPAYEWFVLALAFVGIVAVLRRPSLLGQLLIWWGVASFTVHSWAGERMPWLIIHPLLPFVLLAGIGVAVLWRFARDARRARRIVVAAPVLVGLAVTMYTSYEAAYVRGGEPQELFVQAAQATPEVPEWVDRLHRYERLVQAEFGRDVTVSIDSDVYWPYGWYLRDFPSPTYAVLDQDSDPPDSDIIFLPHWDRATIGAKLEGYVELDYEHRWWWVPDLDGGSDGFHPAVTVSAWANWLWDREVWDGTTDDPSDCPGSLVGTVYVREEIYELEQRYTATNPDVYAAKPGYDGPCARDDA